MPQGKGGRRVTTSRMAVSLRDVGRGRGHRSLFAEGFHSGGGGGRSRRRIYSNR